MGTSVRCPLDELLLNEILYYVSLIMDILARSKEDLITNFKNPNLLFLVHLMSKVSRTIKVIDKVTGSVIKKIKYYNNFDVAEIVASIFRRYPKGYRFNELREDVDYTHELTHHKDIIEGYKIPPFEKDSSRFSKNVVKAEELGYIEKKVDENFPYRITEPGLFFLQWIVSIILKKRHKLIFCYRPIQIFIASKISQRYSISPECIFPFRAGGKKRSLYIGTMIYNSGIQLSEALKRQLEDISFDLGNKVFQGTIEFEDISFYIHISPPFNEVINVVVWKYSSVRRLEKLSYEELFRVKSEVYNDNENR